MIGDGDCGETGGIKIARGNRSTRRKPAPSPLCPPQMDNLSNSIYPDNGSGAFLQAQLILLYTNLDILLILMIE
jgi:hypothetical protein